MGILTFILWWAALPLQALLLRMMLRKKSYKYFPSFFAYTLYSILATFCRFLFRNDEVVYPFVYWGTDAIYLVLGVAVLYEVFRGVFRNISRSWWFRPIFPLVIFVTFGLTIGRTQVLFHQGGWLMQLVVVSEMGVRLLQVAMFTLLVALVALFGLRWRQHHFGISAGFGIYSTVALLGATKYSEIGTSFAFWWSVLSVLSYTVAVLIWLWYFRTPIAVEIPSSDESPLSLQDLERYKDIVRRVRRP